MIATSRRRFRTYRQDMNGKVLPALGLLRLSAVTRNHVQDLVDQLVARGLSASTVRNAILPLRALYRRALARDEIVLNPTKNLALPAVHGRRDRVARPDEAAALIAATTQAEQAIWATAFYAGLRRGELQALEWTHIGVEQGIIHVQAAWDTVAGRIEPKSRAGNRRRQEAPEDDYPGRRLPRGQSIVWTNLSRNCRNSSRRSRQGTDVATAPWS